MYLVNYGQTGANYLGRDKVYGTKKAAVREATQTVRELGSDAWAVVKNTRVGFGHDPIIARWRNGRRVTV